MVDESPSSWSFQDVVEVVLELAVAGVSAAALRAVCKRLSEETQAGALLSPLALRTSCTCRPRRGTTTSCRQQTVARPHGVVHCTLTGLHIFKSVFLSSAARWCLHPETCAAALISAVIAGHGITSEGWECALGSRTTHIYKENW